MNSSAPRPPTRGAADDAAARRLRSRPALSASCRTLVRRPATAPLALAAAHLGDAGDSGGRRRGPAARSARSGPARGDLPGRTRVCAVSYTHLRAHETVLDLVCRLL